MDVGVREVAEIPILKAQPGRNILVSSFRSERIDSLLKVLK
jgi:hypothetical protein